MISSPVRAFDASRAVGWLLAAGGALLVAAMVLRLPPELLVLAPAGVLLGVAVVRRPWLGGLLLVASVPVQQAGAIGAGGASITVTRAFLAVSVTALVLWLAVERRPVVVHRGVVLLGLMLFVLVASAHVASDEGAAGAEVARWTIAFVGLVCLVQFFGTGEFERTRWLAGTVIVITAAEALFGMAQSARAVGPESFIIGGGLTRAFGTFGRPNTFAGFLEFGPFIALALGLRFGAHAFHDLGAYRITRLRGFSLSAPQRERLLKNGAIAIACLGCAGVVMLGILASFSRGAWVGVAAGAVTFAFLFGPRIRMVVVLAFPLVALFFVSGLAERLPGSLEERVGSISDVARPFDASSVTVTDENFAAVERMAHWQAGWRMFEDHPLLGVGTGNFNERYPDYYVRADFRFSQGHAHNFYIHMLAENGLLGLLTYLTLLGFFGLLALRTALFAPDGLARSIALGCCATLVSLSVHNLFENLHVLNLSIMYSAIWCLIIAAHRGWRGTGTSAPVQHGRDMEYSQA